MEETKRIPEQEAEEEALERVVEEQEELDDYLEEQGIYIRQ